MKSESFRPSFHWTQSSQKFTSYWYGRFFIIFQKWSTIAYNDREFLIKKSCRSVINDEMFP